MYYPKSQIQTNLYTNGQEYVIKNTTEYYVGFYYKLSNGRLYAGKEPQSLRKLELVIPEDVPVSEEEYESNKIRIALFEGDPDPVFDVNESLFNGISIVEYTELLAKGKINLKTRLSPTPYHPKPTFKEEQIGEYRRYFAKKTNELIYIEISEETYDKFISNDPTVASDLYNCLFLPWSLTDSEVNRKVVDLIEKNNNWVAFHHYFRGNFGDGRSGFSEALYTSGGEFLLPNRTSYVGFYHFMPNGAPMTGKSHGGGSDVPLIQIKSSLPLSPPSPSTPSSPTTPTPSPTTPSYSPPSTGGGGGGY